MDMDDIVFGEMEMSHNFIGYGMIRWCWRGKVYISLWIYLLFLVLAESGRYLCDFIVGLEYKDINNTRPYDI